MSNTSRLVKLSCIVTFHNEGILAHKTLSSISRMMKFASDREVACELIIVMDRPTTETVEYIERAPFKTLNPAIIRCNFGDPGLSRNEGVKHSRGSYVAIFDGDDLFSENWLLEGLNACLENNNFVVHPEVSISFGKKNVFLRHPDQRDKKFRTWLLLTHNQWSTANCLASKNIFRAVPYLETPRHSGFGYEDWHWNCNVIANGFKHVTASKTAMFVRQKYSGSRNQEDISLGVTIRHSNLFSDLELLELSKPAYPPPSDEWDEQLYLLANPDVNLVVKAGEFKTGRDHWIKHGRSEGRLNSIKFELEVKKDWDEIAYLIDNLDVKNSIGAGGIASGFQHWIQHGKKEGRPPASKSKAEIRRKWGDEMRRLSEIELEVFPSNTFFKNLQEYKPNLPSTLAHAYSEIFSKIQNHKYTHIYFLPWIIRGGADLVALHHINTISDEFDIKPLVITTENQKSTWQHKLSQKATLIELGGLLHGQLNNEEFLEIMMRIIMQIQPNVIHNINSRAAWEIFVKHGKILSKKTKLFSSLFTFDYGDDMVPFGYAEYLKKCHEFIYKIITDSRSHIFELIKIYGFQESLFTQIKYPQPICDSFTFQSQKKIKILWAGRFCKQKRPDILEKIAKLLPNLEFNVFFSMDLQSPPEVHDVYDRLANMNNISLKGPYDDFKSLLTENYALLLYTSQWDGLPNLILESLASGLPVIAPNIGGIKEVITPESGFLIQDCEDVNAYVSIISGMIRNPIGLAAERKRGLNLISMEHSKEAFNNSLKNLQGYITD